MPKKIPMRKCVATGEQLPKKELLRIVRTPEGELVVDTTGRTNGHGAYLKKDLAVIEIAKKNNALARALSQKIPDEFWEEIAKAMQ
ncbi:MAG: YlxR family protein [Erysipelotrichaceae bacterium]|nr:YlxR family protein [Erysipelotrichaceae bacterium]MDY6035483.1 YlxR family protein [Bulleidia sp.]